MTGDGPRARMALVALDGRLAGPSARLTANLRSAPTADGGGYPLLFGVTGTYWASPQGLRRVTQGAVVADGPTGWLVLECDSLGCVPLLVGRMGDRRPLPALLHASGGGMVSGTLAPDGRRAALYQGDPASGLRLALVDLRPAQWCRQTCPSLPGLCCGRPAGPPTGDWSSAWTTPGASSLSTPVPVGPVPSSPRTCCPPWRALQSAVDADGDAGGRSWPPFACLSPLVGMASIVLDKIHR